jgi:hypothetical protein
MHYPLIDSDRICYKVKEAILMAFSYHQFDLRGIAVSILIGYKLNYLKPCMFIL